MVLDQHANHLFEIFEFVAGCAVERGFAAVVAGVHVGATPSLFCFPLASIAA